MEPPLSRRRGSLPTPSKGGSFAFCKLLTPVSLALLIDNPLVFLSPRPPDEAEQGAPLSHSSGSSHQSSRRSSRNHSYSSVGESAGESHLSSQWPVPVANLSPLSSPGSDETSQISLVQNARGSLLSGNLVLKLPKPKELRKIVISLLGTSYIGFNDRPYEHQTILAKHLELDIGSQLLGPNQRHLNSTRVTCNPNHKTWLLEKGDYWFSWSFLLPSNLPPYERGQFGRTTHKVVGRAKFGTGIGLGAVGKNLSSRLVGVSGVGQEVESESYFVAICNPAGGNEEAGVNLDLNFNVTDTSEYLGPYTVTATSAYFTVAGLLSFKFRLNELPPSKKVIKIYKITGLIKQQYRLISMKDKGPTPGTRSESLPPCQRRKVFVLDHTNVKTTERVFSNGWPIGHSASPQITSSVRRGSIDNTSPLPTRSNAGSPRSNSSSSTSRSRIRRLIMTPSASRDLDSNPQSNSLSEAAHSPRIDETSSSTLLSVRLRGHASSRRLSASRSVDRLPNIRQTIAHSHHLENENSQAELNSNSRQPSSRPDVQAPFFPGLTRSARQESDLFSESSPENISTTESAQEPPRSNASTTNIHNHASRGRAREPSFERPSRAEPSQNRLTAGSSRSRGRRSGARDRFHKLSSEPERDIPIATLTNDQIAWEVEYTSRLPNDDLIRPSTHPGTQTNIQISHTLVFEISYAIEDETPTEGGVSKKSLSLPQSLTNNHHSDSRPKNFIGSVNGQAKSQVKPVTKKILSISKPVQIYSCCCMVESMVLPPYAPYDPHPEMVQNPTPQVAVRQVKCLCAMSTDVLLRTQTQQTNQVENSNSSQNDSTEEASSTRSDVLRQCTPKARVEYRLPEDGNLNETARYLLENDPFMCLVHPWAIPYGLEEENEDFKNTDS